MAHALPPSNPLTHPVRATSRMSPVTLNKKKTEKENPKKNQKRGRSSTRLHCAHCCRIPKLFYTSTHTVLPPSLHYFSSQFPFPARSFIRMKTSGRSKRLPRRYILIFVGILCNAYTSESDNGVQDPAVQEPKKPYGGTSVELLHALRAGSAWEDLLERDAARQESIAVQNTATEPLHPGLKIGTGNYIASIAFGTPPTKFSLLIDTGSDITWIQCLPCDDCYSQAQDFFNPTRSRTFQTLPCNSSLCGQLQGSIPADCGNGTCTYGAFYNDRSLTEGDFVRDILGVGSDRVRGFAFGCGHSNRGRLFGGAAGLLGLGRSPLSFPSQTAETYGQIFSYCLPSFDAGDSNVGSLYFGEGSIPAHAEIFFVPLVAHNPVLYHYYVRLSGISVGGEILHILPHLRDPSHGGGGIIVDSGTLVTRLVEPFYRVFREAFRNRTSHIPGAPADSIFDTCYKINRNSAPDNDISAAGKGFGLDIPSVGFIFENGVELTLPAKSVLIRMPDDPRTACLAFAATLDVANKDLSIIGSFQQQDLRVIYDPRNARIGFAAQLCSRPS